MIGTFANLIADTLTIHSQAAGNAGVRIPLVLLSRFDVSAGRKGGHGLQGALIGSLAGLAVGYLVGTSVCSDCYGSTRDIYTGAGVGAGMLIGGVGGYFIGARNPEIWRPVNLDELRQR